MLEYWQERVPVRRFGPIAAAIASAPQFAASRGPAAFAIDSAIAWLLLAQFRLWDDLVDRERDRERHPQRVLTRTPRVGRYLLLCVALAFANALLLRLRERPEVTLLLLASLTVGLAIGYTQPERSTALDLLKLAKYPVFVLLIAAGHAEPVGAPAYAVASAAFLAAIAYEVWHDPETPLRLLDWRSR